LVFVLHVSHITSGNAPLKQECVSRMNLRAGPLERANTESVMNTRTEDFGQRRHAVSWRRLLLAGVVALTTAPAQMVRAEDSDLRPLNTFTTVPAPRIERNIAPDAMAVRAGDSERRRAFLDALVVWLSRNFALPARFEHPTIRFVPAQAIVAIRYAALLNDPTKAAAVQGDVVSVYNMETHTIHMRDDWKGVTPAEVSVLVHEMVHHLQALARLKFACPQEREQVAFQAQQRWLNAFDTDLEREFELDPFSLLVNSNCGL
jgi:hypothetical protein